MQYSPHDLFVGAIDNAPNCTENTTEQEIWSKFMLMVILQGEQQFVIDGLPFRLNAGVGEGCKPIVVMLNVARPARLRFINASEVPLRKVMISAPQPWLDRLMATQEGVSAKALRGFFTEHLAYFSFEPGKNILQLASKIASPPPMLEGEMLSMYLNAQALDIMWQCCLALVADRTEAIHTPSLMSLRHCERVRDFILANLDGDLSIDMIAREAGASSSTIQRHFKEHFGVTIFDFIRSERLSAARKALETSGIQVSQAAHIAGYNNISSFTTAFRKAFGVTPKQIRV